MFFNSSFHYRIFFFAFPFHFSSGFQSTFFYSAHLLCLLYPLEPLTYLNLHFYNLHIYAISKSCSVVDFVPLGCFLFLLTRLVSFLLKVRYDLSGTKNGSKYSFSERIHINLIVGGFVHVCKYQTVQIPLLSLFCLPQLSLGFSKFSSAVVVCILQYKPFSCKPLLLRWRTVAEV